MAKFKIKHTITKKEWNKKHKDFKSMIDGVPYIMMYDDKTGTHLVPVKIVDESVNEAYVPSNIKDFAKRKGVTQLVNTVAGWAEKVAKGIKGGTAIGKNYNTLILDMSYNGSEIRINCEDETIELYDEPVRNFQQFKKVYNEYQMDESVNEADVVGKTVFSDGKGKLFFGYYKTDDGVEFVDYKTWAKLSFKDVSKGDTNKDRVVNSILKNQKQFNKKVDYNMWAKKTNPSFEQKMDWFIKNGWISNINKGGIKESVELVKESVSKEAMGIAGFTGTRGSAVQDFIDKHELDAAKLFKSIKTANLKGRLNFVSALVGKDGNPNQRLTIKLHKKN